MNKLIKNWVVACIFIASFAIKPANLPSALLVVIAQQQPVSPPVTEDAVVIVKISAPQDITNLMSNLHKQYFDYCTHPSQEQPSNWCGLPVQPPAPVTIEEELHKTITDDIREQLCGIIASALGYY